MKRRNTIRAVIATPGYGGFFFDDQAAIKAGAIRDGAAYLGAPLTPGYRAVREPAESVSIQLVLEDGYVAKGDVASVQYSGVGGREPRFRAVDLAEAIRLYLAPALVGLDVSVFRSASAGAERLIQGCPGLGQAAVYGVSQALLDAAAHAAGHHLMARVVMDEWSIPGTASPVPIYGQTGDERYDNADKLILKRLPVIPHGLINTPELVGDGGAALVRYVHWLRERIATLCPRADYVPVIHLDVYGQIGVQAEGDIERAALIIRRVEQAADGHQLRIEHPMHASTRDEQIKVSRALREVLAGMGSSVQLIADEWANTLNDIRAFAEAGAADLIQIKTPDLGSVRNTVEAVLLCQRNRVGAVLGGTCAETDVSARVTTNIGIATGVTQLLAKPGMGVDEGFAIVSNEINRAVHLDRYLVGWGRRGS